jgi:alcohol dehydrogenase class IV
VSMLTGGSQVLWTPVALRLAPAEFSPPLPVPFRWHDGERIVVFGRGRLVELADLLEPGYELLTTPRAAMAAPAILDAAAAVHEVPAGRVDELAASLRPEIHGQTLVALGGGRVIDVGKALAAADPPRRVAAVPTTLSGAEMTAVHRHAAGVPADAPRVRPAIVVNDPVLSASQPLRELAQSAGNALGHAVEGPLTPLSNPLASAAGLYAARLLAEGLADESHEPDRDRLALGSLLAGYVIGATGYGLHHVVSQTLARYAGVAHGVANAVVLPYTIGALARRSPDHLGALRDAIGCEPSVLAIHLRRLGGVERLRDAGVAPEVLERCAQEASRRSELKSTPPPADSIELRELYEAAY